MPSRPLPASWEDKQPFDIRHTLHRPGTIVIRCAMFDSAVRMGVLWLAAKVWFGCRSCAGGKQLTQVLEAGPDSTTGHGS
jgi:hypothetical protein